MPRIVLCAVFLGLSSRLDAQGRALHFDGVDDRVQVGSFVHSLEEFTIEAWIRKVRPTDWWFDTIVSTDAFRFQIERGNQMEFWDARGSERFGPVVTTDGAWHHVALVWRGGNHLFYLDGVTPGGSTDPGSAVLEMSQLRIGHDGLSRLGADDPFDGDIDEVRFWDHARSAEEIEKFQYAHLSGNEPGLIGYWVFEELAGQVAEDGSPAAAHGQLGGLPSEDQADPDRIRVTDRQGVSAAPACGYVPLAVAFELAAGAEVSEFAWDFGDGATSAEASPIHVYETPGEYEVALSARDPAGILLEFGGPTIEVLAVPPAAAFDYSPKSGDVPLRIAFEDLSTGPAVSYAWEFGDGATSAERNPSHLYAIRGEYEVRLTVTGPCPEDSRNSSTASTRLFAGLVPVLELIPRGPRCVALRVTTRFAIQGGEVGLAYDPALVEVSHVREGADLPPGSQVHASLTPPIDGPAEDGVSAGLIAGWIQPIAGGLATLGPGKHEVLRICFRPASGSEPEPCSPLRFIECLGPAGAPVLNVVTLADGPSLAIPPEDGQVCVHDPILFRRGDANDDGSFDISDPIAILKCLFLGIGCGSCFETYDANDDGAANITDAVHLLRWRFLGGDSPPPPFPACGRDATGLDADCDAYGSCGG